MSLGSWAPGKTSLKHRAGPILKSTDGALAVANYLWPAFLHTVKEGTQLWWGRGLNTTNGLYRYHQFNLENSPVMQKTCPHFTDVKMRWFREVNNLLMGTHYLYQNHNQIQVYMTPKPMHLLLHRDVSNTQSGASFQPNTLSCFYRYELQNRFAIWLATSLKISRHRFLIYPPSVFKNLTRKKVSNICSRTPK